MKSFLITIKCYFAFGVSRLILNSYPTHKTFMVSSAMAQFHMNARRQALDVSRVLATSAV